MASNADFFLKKTLGDDFFESLQKVELWKPGTRTTIDHEEIRTALKIVPRTVMSMLIRELAPMNIGDNKDVQIPVSQGMAALLKVTKHERDVYTGVVEQDNKVLVDFKYRSIPGIGLVIMSALELYDVDSLSVPSHEQAPDSHAKIQQLIDERLAMHDLINRVVEKKLQEKDAIQQLVLAKITQTMDQHKAVANLQHFHEKLAVHGEDYQRGLSDGLKVAKKINEGKIGEEVKAGDNVKYLGPKLKKVSPLGGFLEKRKTKSVLKKNEFSIQLAKGEHVSCPDCGSNIFDGQAFAGCICVGDDMERKVYLKKTEDGIKVRFSKGWDQENIEMLLEVLRRKNG